METVEKLPLEEVLFLFHSFCLPPSCPNTRSLTHIGISERLAMKLVVSSDQDKSASLGEKDKTLVENLDMLKKRIEDIKDKITGDNDFPSIIWDSYDAQENIFELKPLIHSLSQLGSLPMSPFN